MSLAVFMTNSVIVLQYLGFAQFLGVMETWLQFPRFLLLHLPLLPLSSSRPLVQSGRLSRLTWNVSHHSPLAGFSDSATALEQDARGVIRRPAYAKRRRGAGASLKQERQLV